LPHQLRSPTALCGESSFSDSACRPWFFQINFLSNP
jgi:hypothetical protein